MYEAQSEFKEGRGGRGGLTEQSLMSGKVQQLYRYFQELQVHNSYAILQMPECGPCHRGGAVVGLTDAQYSIYWGLTLNNSMLGFVSIMSVK